MLPPVLCPAMSHCLPPSLPPSHPSYTQPTSMPASVPIALSATRCALSPLPLPSLFSASTKNTALCPVLCTSPSAWTTLALQADAKAAARPRVEGLDLEARASQMDLLPLLTTAPNLPTAEQPRAQGTQGAAPQAASGTPAAPAVTTSSPPAAAPSVPVRVRDAGAATQAPLLPPGVAALAAPSNVGSMGSGAGSTADSATAAVNAAVPIPAPDAAPAAASRAQPRLLLDPVSSGQPLRARVSGSIKMALRAVPVPGQAPAAGQAHAHCCAGCCVPHMY